MTIDSVSPWAQEPAIYHLCSYPTITSARNNAAFVGGGLSDVSKLTLISNVTRWEEIVERARFSLNEAAHLSFEGYRCHDRTNALGRGDWERGTPREVLGVNAKH